MRVLARKLALLFFNSALDSLGAVKARGYDTADTIVISSYPRSGSTWLAEILSTIPGTCIMWEPLNPGDHWVILGLKKNPALEHLGLDEYPVVAPGSPDDRPDVYNYIERVLMGRALSRYTLSHAIAHIGWRRIVASERWIVKFCRANGILHWMTHRFPVKPIVLMRHPCAVIASQKSHPGWGHLDVDTLARLWSVNHSTLLTGPPGRPWLVVAYEGLVTRKDDELARIFDWLGLPMPVGARAALEAPSATASERLKLGGDGTALTTWEGALTRGEVRSILATARLHGIDFYDQNREPDYDRLAELGSP
jgi:hypothetical protein